MLAGVDSDDPNDVDVAYAYRGDLKPLLGLNLPPT